MLIIYLNNNCVKDFYLKRQERCPTAMNRSTIALIPWIFEMSKLVAGSEQSGQWPAFHIQSFIYLRLFSTLAFKVNNYFSNTFGKLDLNSHKPSMSCCSVHNLQRAQNAITLRRAYYSFTDLDNFHSLAIGSRLCRNMRTTQRSFCRCAHRAIVSTRRYLCHNCT